MTTKLVQNGDRIKVTLAANATVNLLYALEGGSESGANGMPVVCALTGTTGDSVDFITQGVFTLAKKAEALSAMNQGDVCYWRTTGGANLLTGKATGSNGVAGTAWVAAVTGATTATIKLVGGGGPASAAP